MNRFKMEFNNSRNAQLNHLENMLQLKGGVKSTVNPVTNFSLSSPMIHRIHAAKPGCSACGKKVA